MRGSGYLKWTTWLLEDARGPKWRMVNDFTPIKKKKNHDTKNESKSTLAVQFIHPLELHKAF